MSEGSPLTGIRFLAVFSKAAIGRTHRGACLCAEWELRVTERCLVEDLGVAPNADFDELKGLEIVKALMKDRRDQSYGTREISPVECGVTVWRLGYGHDHRGATWYDEQNHIVWLLRAHSAHRSGEADDFFPWFKALQADEQLPSDGDYERLLLDRDARFAFTIRLEAPMVLKEARKREHEYRVMLGGTHGACIAIEAADDLEEVSVAFKVDSVEYAHVPIILQALLPGEWEPAGEMPSRALDDGEYAFRQMREAE